MKEAALTLDYLSSVYSLLGLEVNLRWLSFAFCRLFWLAEPLKRKDSVCFWYVYFIAATLPNTVRFALAQKPCSHHADLLLVPSKFPVCALSFASVRPANMLQTECVHRFDSSHVDRYWQ